MKITVFADLHRFGPNEVEEKNSYGKNVFYLGDIYECKNIRKKMLKRVKEAYYIFVSICKDNKVVVLNGNHEQAWGKVVDSFHYIEEKKCYLLHGDKIDGKFSDWRTREPKGKSGWFLKFIKYKNKTMYKMKSDNPKLSEKKKEAIYRYVKGLNFDIETVIIGHFHPKKTIDVMYKGIRIVVCKRGKTEIDL